MGIFRSLWNIASHTETAVSMAGYAKGVFSGVAGLMAGVVAYWNSLGSLSILITVLVVMVLTFLALHLSQNVPVFGHMTLHNKRPFVRGVSGRMRVAEAVLQLYDRLQDTADVRAARQLNSDIENYLALILTKDGDVAIYGKRPPSRIHVPVPPDEFQELFFEEQANVLQHAFPDGGRYEDLEISRADFRRKMKELERRYRG